MALAAIVNGSDKFRSPSWATKIFSVWLTTVEFMELVLTSLTIVVVDVASPVPMAEVGEELSVESCPELSLPAGVMIAELLPVLVSD